MKNKNRIRFKKWDSDKWSTKNSSDIIINGKKCGYIHAPKTKG